MTSLRNKILAFFLVTVLVQSTGGNLRDTQRIYQGRVLGENGPVSGAVVRIQATDLWTTSDDQGRFRLECPAELKNQRITAWAPGYYITVSDADTPTDADITLKLTAHTTKDNKAYEWERSYRTTEDGQVKGCAECHSKRNSTLPFDLPFDEWEQDAHALTAHNKRFLSVYAGADILGNQSPLTRFVPAKDYGMRPLRPDSSRPYFGPGYKLDFPATAGNCAACHLPVAAIDNPYGVDPTSIKGAAKEGISCDFCHKTWDVRLDPETGLPFEDMPGVLSFEFRRPEGEHQFFSGPLDDVAPGEDACAPFQRESRFCAPCHFGKFWDTVVYNSYGEWLESPYSDPESGQTCQDCHMPRTGTPYMARPDKGGLKRDPTTIFGHKMPGAADTELLENAVSVKLDAARKAKRIAVVVQITNDRTGHHIPTGSPLRHLILLVRAWNEDGSPLKLMEGSVLPDWVGRGDPDKGNYALLPGKAFAKVLENVWTKSFPSTEYWQHTRIVSDNRIAAFATDASEYVFEAPQGASANIEVLLIFRRAFKELMDQKKWAVPDLVIAHKNFHVPAQADGMPEATN